jgi:hypothetical protein
MNMTAMTVHAVMSPVFLRALALVAGDTEIALQF